MSKYNYEYIINFANVMTFDQDDFFCSLDSRFRYCRPIYNPENSIDIENPTIPPTNFIFNITIKSKKKPIKENLNHASNQIELEQKEVIEVQSENESELSEPSKINEVSNKESIVIDKKIQIILKEVKLKPSDIKIDETNPNIHLEKDKDAFKEKLKQFEAISKKFIK